MFGSIFPIQPEYWNKAIRNEHLPWWSGAFIRADNVTIQIPVDLSLLPLHRPDMESRCINVKLGPVVCFLGEVNVEIHGAAGITDVASLFYDDVDLHDTVSDSLSLAFRRVFLLGRVRLMQPEGTQQAFASRALAANLEPAVFLHKLVEDLILGGGRSKPVIRGLEATDARRAFERTERQLLVNARLPNSLFDNPVRVVILTIGSDGQSG